MTPMFPLGMALLPGGVLPLHVFEPRYRQMMVDVLDDDPYPRAVVEDWPDGAIDRDPERFDVELAATHARVRAVLATAAELGDVPAETATSAVELADDPELATFHLAALAPIGPADRYRLLVAEDPAMRLDLLDEILGDVEAAQRFRLG